MSFSVTLATVVLMFAYAIPGYLLMKNRIIKPDCIPAFAAVLLYLNSPFQTLHAMQQIEYSPYMVRYLLWAIALGFLTMGGMMAIMYCIFLKKQQQVPYRIVTAASAMGNCGFMGLPLLEALMPEYPQMVAFTAMYFVAYNVIMWTVTSFIITRDRRYISVRKILLNPAVIAMGVALVLFFGRINFTGQVASTIAILSKMATPMCMLILGMRLALLPIKPIFVGKLQYLTAALKLVVFPLAVLALCRLLPLEENFVRGMFIISAVPVGNMVLSFAEILGEGQETAAHVVLLTTLMSIVSLPFMLMLV